MSIAGIFKEVSTISISAWVFGDQLTDLNIIGVVITVCGECLYFLLGMPSDVAQFLDLSGIALYTFHKYQRTISSDVPLDPQGEPYPSDGHQPSITAPPRFYAMANTEREPLRSSDTNHDGVPLASLDSSIALDRQRPGYSREETAEDRTNRLRDEFEGWNGVDGSDEDDPEAGEGEVERRRNERVRTDHDDGIGSWGEWWDKEM